MEKKLGKFNEVSHLEITKTEWSEVSDPIVRKDHCLRQLPPGTKKILIKTRTGELTSLLSALQEFMNFPHLKNTHPLTRHSVKELFRHRQSSVSDNQLTIPKRNKTTYN